MKDLEQAIADARADAQVLRSRGHERDASLMESVINEITAPLEDYRRFVGESDASLASGKSVKWLRGQFPEWESLGHARKAEGGRREYRMIVLPRRVNLSAAREEGRREARRDAA